MQGNETWRRGWVVYDGAGEGARCGNQERLWVSMDATGMLMVSRIEGAASLRSQIPREPATPSPYAFCKRPVLGEPLVRLAHLGV